MKKLLLSFLLFPFISNAQLEFGINGGIAPFKVIHSDNQTGYIKNNVGSYFDFVGSFKLPGGLKVGIDIASNSLTYSANGSSPISGTLLYYARPLIASNITIEHEVKIKRSCIYFGIVGGALSVKNSDRYGAQSSGHGFDVGARVGYTYNLYKGICLNAQVSAIYGSVDISRTSYWGQNITSPFIYFPIQLGLHYKIHFTKKKK